MGIRYTNIHYHLSVVHFTYYAIIHNKYKYVYNIGKLISLIYYLYLYRV